LGKFRGGEENRGKGMISAEERRGDLMSSVLMIDMNPEEEGGVKALRRRHRRKKQREMGRVVRQ